MTNKKGFKGKILAGIICASSIIAVGASSLAIVSNGFTNMNPSTWFLNEPSTFKEVKIENKEIIYDGLSHCIDIVVPKNAEYSFVAKKDGQIVVECIDVGEYVYEVKVKIDNIEKDYVAKLVIQQHDINKSHVKMIKVSDIEYKIKAVILPIETTDRSVEWTLAFQNPNSLWATGKNVNTYIKLNKLNATEATVTLLLPFAERIELKATSNSNTDLTTTCVMDYSQKLKAIETKVNNSLTPLIEDNDTLVFQDTKIVDTDFTIPKDYPITHEFNEFNVTEYGTLKQTDMYKYNFNIVNTYFKQFLDPTKQWSSTNFFKFLQQTNETLGTHKVWDVDEQMYGTTYKLSAIEFYNAIQKEKFIYVSSSGLMEKRIEVKFSFILKASSIAIDHTQIVF